jgi:LysR family transcriptional regulator, glycine cleavage system transcriptional activator
LRISNLSVTLTFLANDGFSSRHEKGSAPVNRRIPPLPAIRAFESAARRGSFKSAAEELCVDASAISHQVRLLEDLLDVRLFRRSPGQVVLTADGKRYFAALRPLLDEMDRATRAVSRRADGAHLAVQTTPAFAARWLMPRLGRFRGSHAGITLELSTGLPPTDLRRDRVDLVVQWGDEPVAGLRVEPFMASTRIPVCSPAFLVARPGLKRPADLRGDMLLRDVVNEGWEEWFARAACVGITASGPRFAHCELSMRAAEAGLGVDLGYCALIGPDLEAGRLVALFDIESPAQVIYSLAWREEDRDRRAVIAFRDWLFREILAEPPRAGLMAM